MSDEPPMPPLSVEEIEELLTRRRISRQEQQHILRRALTGATQLRKLRVEYDREMRERVAAAASGRRSWVDPSQVVAFLSPEQREQLLDRMSQDRLAAQERLLKELQQRRQRLQDLQRLLQTMLQGDEEQQIANLRQYRQELENILEQEGDDER